MMETAEASRVEEFTKIRDENKDLKCKLWDSQVGLQALASDHTIVTAKVSVLEARARATKERVAQEEFLRDAAIQKVVEQAMDNFKQSKEYAAIMTA